MSIQRQPYGDDFLSTLDHAEETMVWMTNMFRAHPSLGTVLAGVHLVEREITSLQAVQHRARGNHDFHTVLSLYQDYLSLLQSVSRAEPKRRKSTRSAGTSITMGQTNTTPLELIQNSSTTIQPTYNIGVLGQPTRYDQQTSLRDAQIGATPTYTAVQRSSNTLPVARVRPFHTALATEGRGLPYQRSPVPTQASTSAGEPVLILSQDGTGAGQPAILVKNVSTNSMQPASYITNPAQTSAGTGQPTSNVRQPAQTSMSTIYPATNVEHPTLPNTTTNESVLIISHTSSTTGQPVILVQNVNTSSTQPVCDVIQSTQATCSTIQPASNMMLPSTSTIQPPSNMRLPSTSTTQPPSNMRLPSTSTIQPPSNMRLPSTSTIQPPSNMRLPSTSTIQPTSNMRLTSTSTNQCASNMRLTSTFTIQPPSNMRLPSTNTVQPPSSMRLPSTSAIQAYSNMRHPIQPSTNTIQAFSNMRLPIQPSTSTMQPAFSMSQPTVVARNSSPNGLLKSDHEAITRVSANTKWRRQGEGSSMMEILRLRFYTRSDIPYHLSFNRGSNSGHSGPNSMWHLECLRKLYRWKMAIVMVVDDFSRKILAMKVTTDNSSTTILETFNMAVAEFGHPVAVRCDSSVQSQPFQEYMDRCSVNVVVGPSNNRNNGHKRLFFRFCDFYLQLLQLEDTGDLNIWMNSHLFALHYTFIPHIQESAKRYCDMRNSGNSRRGPDKSFREGVSAEARCPYEGVGRFLDHCHKVWSGTEITLVPLPEGPPAPGNIEPVQCPLTEEQLQHLQETIDPLTYNKDVETVYRVVRDYINHII